MSLCPGLAPLRPAALKPLGPVSDPTLSLISPLGCSTPRIYSIHNARYHHSKPSQRASRACCSSGNGAHYPGAPQTAVSSSLERQPSERDTAEVKPPDQVLTSQEPDIPGRENRYGWPDRSDVYILRTDGNACARTLVKGTGRLQLAYPSSYQYMLVWQQKPKTVMIVKKLGDGLMDELSAVARHLIDNEDMNVVVEPAVHRKLAQKGEAANVFTFTPDQGRRLGDFIDFVVCLGGDGVILHTSQLFRSHVPPIIAFHLGSLGFLSQHSYGTVTEDLSNVIYGRSNPSACSLPDGSASMGVNVSLRMRLACDIIRSGKVLVDQQYEVLNEVVVDRGSSSFLTNITVYERDTFLTRVQADGLMIATPTGSTAYSAAAGGSMVHPEVPAILFTPICPHSLNFRPIVLPDYAELRLIVGKDARAGAWVSFDGKHRQELQQGDVLRVRMSPNPVATINRVDQTRDWMHSLDRCFGWSNRVTQQAMDF